MASESNIPRTRIYSVLDSLARKGWVKIISGMPLLFRPNPPADIIERLKSNYEEFLTNITEKVNEKVNSMKEKYVITKQDIGLKSLKSEVAAAKTVWITNATTEFLQRVKDHFQDGAEVKVVMFPNETPPEDENIQSKEAQLEIVHIIKKKETPGTSVILDEERFFTVLKDPINNNYIVTEMLYDDCTKCFREWTQMDWGDQA